MNIVEPYARIMDVPHRAAGIALIKKIEWCARISHRTEDTQTDDSWDRFVRAVVLQHGDWSVVEHASVTVDFLVDRGITHELVRHRLCAFTQESTRFVNYKKKIPASFIEPPGMNSTSCLWWKDSIRKSEDMYEGMIEAGSSPQIARSVFPNALASRLVVTSNLRNWRHLLLMRTTKEAHPQMRQVMIPLLADFKERIPILFEDIVPMERQAEAIKKGR